MFDFNDDLVGQAGAAASTTTNPKPQQQQQSQNQDQQQQQQQNSFLFRRLKMLTDQNDKMFDSRKKNIVSDLSKAQYCDLSPKGSVDEGCQPLMKILNDHNDYVSTSSCSGRISVFHMASKIIVVSNKNDDDDEEKEESKNKNTKRGEADVATGWVFISHDPVSSDKEILTSVADFCQKFNIKMNSDSQAKEWERLRSSSTSSDKDSEQTSKTTKYQHQLSFVVEPFVMHVSCRDTASAQQLLQAAVQAGYRNSGAVLAGSNDTPYLGIENKKDKTKSVTTTIPEPPAKITVAIRHTAGIHVPLVLDSECFASVEYVSALVTKANLMMKENEDRIKRLEQEVIKRIVNKQ